MKHVVSQELHAYWDRLRGARAAPERSDLDPAAIRTILADTFLAEANGERSLTGRDFIIHLSGTRLDAMWGEDLKYRPLLSLWRREDQHAVRELVDLVLDDQMPVVAGARSSDKGWGSVEFETLFLPLRHHGKTHTRLFGSIVPSRTDAPWRGHDLVKALALTTFRTLAPSPGFAAAPIVKGRQYGRFMVYEGGR